MDQATLNTILITGTVASVVVYLLLSLWRGNGKSVKESNELLRGLVDDQRQEILKMRDRVHLLTNELQAVKLQVQHLTDKREYLEKLVHMALLEHFSRDPRVAQAAREAIADQQAAA
jgi:hypothetical protein